jgi:hypothetical protein
MRDYYNNSWNSTDFMKSATATNMKVLQYKPKKKITNKFIDRCSAFSIIFYFWQKVAGWPLPDPERAAYTSSQKSVNLAPKLGTNPIKHF